MAIVADQFVSLFSRTTFRKLPDAQRNLTSSPRAMVNFHVDAGVLSAKPLNDDQTVAISVDLPLEFCYRMLDVNVVFRQDVASSWNARPFIEVTNGVRGLPLGNDQAWPLVMEAGQTGASGGSIEMVRPNVRGLPQMIFQTVFAGVAPVLTFRAANNQDPAGAAGTIDFLLTFLEYEVEQSWNANLYWPLQTYIRN